MEFQQNYFSQPLANERCCLKPLKIEDFEALYAVANDPLIWEQHPNKERYQKEEFLKYFDGAMKSGTAFLIIANENGEIAGATRFYDYDPVNKSVFIGYTFYARKYWGNGLNPSVKKLMLSYAFEICEAVYFHVGASNIRSQMAMQKIGGQELRELEVAYYNEPSRINKEYVIYKHSYNDN